jgi:diguanylate cyclase (GGDEF)-like protein
MAVVAWCVLVRPGYADPPITNPSTYLDQAESLRLEDHPRFAQMLERIHHDASRLTEADRWHLRYLDAWEASFKGNYDQPEAELRQVMDHSGDPVLIAKSSALLLKLLAINRHYEEAFGLANHLASTLPDVKDPLIRFTLLTNLSEMLDLADQTNLAVEYAQMAAETVPPGETLCRPLLLQAAALYNAKRLTSTSEDLRRAIDVCTAARQPILANAMWLVLANLYLDENKPVKALALLDQLAPSIRSNNFYPHMLSSQVERAQAYFKLGNSDEAKKAALAALAISQPDDTSEWLMNGYQVLYELEKKEGHNAAALAYYERYSVLEKNHIDDVHARALAYDMAEQHLLAQKMQAEGLSKQNNILKLQQALASKAVEASRLYIALLLLVLVSVVFWLFRLKRSQLRFKELSCRDGLTGISNHQHFMSEADRVLHMMEKRRGTACLVAIDLDHFKQINDTYGHALGDTVLKRTVAACQHQLRPNDLFGRLGGEEFCVLLADCRRDQGKAIANGIRMAIEASIVDVEGQTVSFSASIGVACTDTSGYELQRLCRDADMALYTAKRNGRNRVIAHGKSDGSDAQDFGKRASLF